MLTATVEAAMVVDMAITGGVGARLVLFHVVGVVVRAVVVALVVAVPNIMFCVIEIALLKKFFYHSSFFVILNYYVL